MDCSLNQVSRWRFVSWNGYKADWYTYYEEKLEQKGEYKIEIKDYSKINIAEFSDKYEIIETDGNIWTIEENK